VLLILADCRCQLIQIQVDTERVTAGVQVCGRMMLVAVVCVVVRAVGLLLQWLGFRSAPALSAAARDVMLLYWCKLRSLVISNFQVTL
jgi:hypothetical protein